MRVVPCTPGDKSVEDSNETGCVVSEAGDPGDAACLLLKKTKKTHQFYARNKKNIVSEYMFLQLITRRKNMTH